MGTLIDILLGLLLFMFTAISLTMVCGWLILQFVGLKKEEECEYIMLGIGSMQGGTSLYNRVKNHPYLVDKKIFNQINNISKI